MLSNVPRQGLVDILRLGFARYKVSRKQNTNHDTLRVKNQDTRPLKQFGTEKFCPGI